MKNHIDHLGYGEQKRCRSEGDVRSEIQYLDSKTDYLESISTNIPLRTRSPLSLEDCERSFRRWFISLVVVLGSIAMFVVWIIENSM